MNKATIYISGEIGIHTKLVDVISQFKSFENPDSVKVIIDSFGGSVSEGNSIYNFLRNLNIPVTTFAKKAYSISATIFMAGDIRIVENIENAFMIHLPLATDLIGDADFLDFVSSELRKTEKEFTNFYSELTKIDKDTVYQLLRNETFMSGKEAVEMGFATQLNEKTIYKAVAKFDKNKNEKNMNKKEKGLIKAIKAFLSPDLKALVLQDSKGDEINFLELLEGDEPKKGDKAEVVKDGENIPADGEFLTKEGDKKWIFEKGELVDIQEVEAETEEEETNEDLEKLIKDLEKSLLAKFDEKFKNQNEKISNLKKIVGSASVKVEAKKTDSKQKTKNYLR